MKNFYLSAISQPKRNQAFIGLKKWEMDMGQATTVCCFMFQMRNQAKRHEVTVHVHTIEKWLN